MVKPATELSVPVFFGEFFTRGKVLKLKTLFKIYQRADSRHELDICLHRAMDELNELMVIKTVNLRGLPI